MNTADPCALALRLAAPVLATLEVLPTLDPADLGRGQAAMDEALTAFETESSRRFGESAAQAGKYALVALTDETAQRHPGALRDFWKPRTLQLRYFGDNRAGYGFFTRLNALRAERATLSRDVALACYLLALQLGFAGRYDDVSGGRDGLAHELAETLRILADDSEPSAGVRLVERSGGARRPLPPEHGPWLRIAGLIFLGSLFFTARCALDEISAEVGATLRGDRAGV